MLKDLQQLLEPVTRGDPMSHLRWTSKSTRKLAAELEAKGHEVSHSTIAHLLAIEPPHHSEGMPITAIDGRL